MAIYANESGSLKNMSKMDMGGYIINGIEYLGKVYNLNLSSPRDDFDTLVLEKNITSYKYIIVILHAHKTYQQNFPTTGFGIMNPEESFITDNITKYAMYIGCNTGGGNPGGALYITPSADKKILTFNTYYLYLKYIEVFGIY